MKDRIILTAFYILIILLFLFLYSRLQAQTQYELPATPQIVYRSLYRAYQFRNVQETRENGGVMVDYFLSIVKLKTGFPWCAAFVSACFYLESDKNNPVPILLTGSSQAMFNDAMKRGVKVPLNPSIGDIVVYKLSANSGHVARILAVLGSGWYYLIGGNESNRVRITRKNLWCPQGRLSWRGNISFNKKRCK
jgi:hypothetical protein